MKKLLFILMFPLGLIFSCKQGKNDMILPRSVGNTNKILTVIKTSDWLGKVGDEIRTVFGEHQVGLPQPETLLSVGQVAPEGFTKVMNINRSVLIIQKADKEAVIVKKDIYAKPQTIVYATAKDEYDLVQLIRKRGKEIIQVFKNEDLKFTQHLFENEKLDETTFKTVQNLDVSLTIPKSYRLVKDSLDFLWLRQHLKSGIARGDGTNNILLYSVPLRDREKIADNITSVRDTIGKKHIPGSKEGMYMITEQAYTPFTYESEIDGKKAYETRGKWEVKNDYMAGPFLNYTIIDEKNNRLVIFEGFTYAPSINKRDFIFELEAIAKTLKIR